jgi:acyl-CoA synthetase (NDP forming)
MMTAPGLKNIIEEIFHPKSIAVIGARSNESLENDGWVSRLIDFGYKGILYPINPKVPEIMGLKAYPSVKDVPGPVDLAIFNIPFRIADQVMVDCADRKVKYVHVFTAGFSETGKVEGIKQQERILQIAKDAGIRIIGPNCMGLYYPQGGLTFGRGFSRQPGPVAFVSQSGASASRVIAEGNERGIFFSKVISYGNAIDLDGTDFIEYLSTDPETRVITSYIEGVQDGRRYFNTIKECTQKKPVIALKAGITEGGGRAAASHTAVLTGSEPLWDAFFRQTGVIRVDDLEELLDAALPFVYSKQPQGRRVGIVGRGGGLGVVATDMCEKAGLKVPPFHPDTQNRLEKLIPDAGTSARNPVEPDKGLAAWAAFYTEGLKAIDEDPGIDLILTHLGIDIYGGRGDRLNQSLNETIGILIKISNQLVKPLAMVLYAGEKAESINAVLLARPKCLAAGIPVFSSVPSAAKALSRFIGYHEYIDRIRNNPK